MKTKPKPKPAPNTNDAYAVAHHQAQDLIKQIGELLFDCPAPDDEERPLDWGHVGSMNEVNRRLAAVVAFLNGTEK